MRYTALIPVGLILAALTLVSCNNPDYAKRKYLQSGNKYFDAGRLHEASIMYRKAIDKDRRFGEAYYRLALTDLKEGSVMAAVPALRRAEELLAPGTPESNDASLKLAEILIVAGQAQQHNEQIVKDVESIVSGLLKRNPTSWEGHKLSGDLAMMTASARFRTNQADEARKQIAIATGEYRKALESKPGDYIISLALARTLVTQGETVEAEKIFRSLFDKDKKNINAPYELYRMYLAERRYPDAESVLKSAVQSNPTNSVLRLTLAQFYFATNRKDDLLALLNQMKNNLKDFPEAYMQAGDFYVRVGQFDEANKQYEEGIQKDPKQKTAYLKHEIEADIRQNKMPLAYAKNEEILKADPKDPEARGLKATFMLDKGGNKSDIQQAVSELQSVVTAKPGNFVAHFNLGRAHFAIGENEQARQEFDKALEIRPDYLPARLAQTQVALVRGDNDAALHDADNLLRIAPGNLQGLILRAQALERLKRNDEARGLLKGIIDKSPNQTEALLEMGVLDLNEKKNKEAAEVFRRAYESNPASSRGLLGESRALLLDGQAAKSVELIRVESEKHPDRLDLMRELGDVQMSATQFDNAIATYHTLLSKLTDSRQKGDIWSRIAQAHRFKHESEQAIAALEKARESMPENAFLITSLAMINEEIGKKDEARKYYEMALKLDQNNPLALNNLAYLITESNGDLNQALTYATRAKQRLPNYPEVTDTLGWIYLKKNLTDNAIDNFRSLVSQAPQNPTYHYHYAMALNQKGDRDSARKECQAALADKPTKPQEAEIRQLLQKLG